MNMNLDYRSDYFDDPQAKAAFERYAKTVFNLDFGLWEERGLWDRAYLPFSAFAGDECVASICVYPAQMLVDGQPKTGAELLTVGTLPEYRGRGIQRELWRRVREWTDRNSDFVFLFTEEEAAGFYEKLGLRRQREHYDVVPCPEAAGAPRPPRKLDWSRPADWELVTRLAHEREMVSARLGAHNPGLLLFMFLYVFTQRSYCCEELDAVIVSVEKGNRLQVHDIVARRMPRLADLAAALASFGGAELEFLFCTDRLEVTATAREEVRGDVLFVSDGFALPGPLIFPASVRA